MKFKQRIAFAAIASSIITNSFCVYAEDTIMVSEQTAIEESSISVNEENILSDSEDAEISEDTDLSAANEILNETSNEIPNETFDKEEESGAAVTDTAETEAEEIAVLSFDGGSGSAENPYQISTAEQLNEVRNNLSANYILTADIDLSGLENFEPIGTFVPLGQSGEEAEMPSPEFAFTGVFDGNGHSISNLKINSPEGFAVALFGCVSSGTIKNVNMTNAAVSGSMMTGCCVGYLFDGAAENIILTDSTVNGTESSMGTDMIGGIVGAGMDSKMNNCSAENITLNLVSGASNAGLAAGGFEVCSISGVNTSGIINAEDNCTGLGGVAGCNFSGDKIENCNSSVTINAGSNAFLIGGTVGYAGGFDSKTLIDNCDADINAVFGSGSSRAGGIIGGGFFNEAYKDYYPNPSSFKVSGCTASGNITCADGKNIGSIAGYTLLSEVDENNTSSVKINGNDGNIIGDPKNYEVLNALQGTYQQFFTDGVFNSKYDKIWHNYCAAVVGESDAENMVSMMKYSIGGKLYGEEAVKKYSASPETTQFFCDFTNGLKILTINNSNDGPNISGTDENGNTLFSHTYYYVDTLDSIDYPGFTFDIFATNENAGEFKYFAFAPDTPDSTYHIEFRYCCEYDDVLNLMSGKYAYWLAAGIRDVDIANDYTTEKVIALFCTENMQYSSERSKDSLAQLSDINGKWNCDMSAFKGIPEYANADMYIEINDNNGIGRTYVDMTGSGNYALASEFFVYAYNTSDTGKEGIYVVYTDDEGVKYSKYKISENDGIETLDFYSVDGEKIISYYREIEKEDTTETTTKEIKVNTESKNTDKYTDEDSSYSRGGKSSGKACVNTNNDDLISDNAPKSSDDNKNENKEIVLKIASPYAEVFGKRTTISSSPVIVNGRTMLPVRFIAENAGYTADWAQSEKKAAISLNNTVIEIYEDSDTAYINGEEVKIDAPAFNDNGTLFVPARFIFEAFGADVSWNSFDKSVTIKMN
ncbi:MAG: copper amine oxidase N-terminal domain-containing protein [Firmicutes bacterium]|nr:copper amine oxidase N-terminal domain-containing protein [Bacillota bacterium]